MPCVATVANEKFRLSEYSSQDERWDNFRGQADNFEDLYRGTIYDSYADRIGACSGRLGFSAFTNPETGEVRLKLLVAMFCRVPRCPVCQWRRQMMWRAKAFKVMPKILKDYPTSRWLFLTLTVRNCHLTELRATLAYMNKSWERLTKLKAFPGIGFLKATEVTRAWDCYDFGHFVGRHGSTWIDKWEFKNKRKLRLVPTDECHPHFHILLMVPPGYFGRNYLTQQKWTEMWRKSLRADYTPLVHIEAVKPRTQVNQGMLDAILETIKYSVKPSEVLDGISNGNVDDAKKYLVELTTQLYKTRSIATGGLLKDYLKLLEEEPDSLISSDDSLADDNFSNSVDIVFKWFSFSKTYTKID